VDTTCAHWQETLVDCYVVCIREIGEPSGPAVSRICVCCGSQRERERERESCMVSQKPREKGREITARTYIHHKDKSVIKLNLLSIGIFFLRLVLQMASDFIPMVGSYSVIWRNQY